MISLESVDKVVRSLPVLNRIVEMLTSKLLPAVPVAAGCAGGYEFYYDTAQGYECWAETSCGDNKCVRVFTRTYVYIEPQSYTCNQLFKICNSTECSTPSTCG